LTNQLNRSPVLFCAHLPDLPPKSDAAGNIPRSVNAYFCTMTKKLLFVVSILLVVAFGAMAADVTGKWTFEQAGRGGGNPITVTLNLKASGGSLTGTMSRPGRDGNAMETPISNGKVDGNDISFDTVQSFGGNEMKTQYKGTVNGDSIDLSITRPGRNGGDPVTVKVTAKKATT
jgi:hypothetical protein